MIRKILGLGIITLLSVFYTIGVFANVQTTEIELEITGGSLTLEVGDIQPFGSHIIQEDVFNITTSFNENDGVTVKDLRGTWEGWTLSLTSDVFRTIDGAAIRSGSFTLNGVNTPVLEGGLGDYEEIKPAINDEIEDSVVIDTGDKIVLGGASEDKGMGVWKYTFPNDAFQLVINPIDVYAGNYETVITWTLEATPYN